MEKTTRNLIAGMALLLMGLSLAIAVTLTAPQPARANPGILYAAPNGATSGTCNSWANACTLQYALSRAVSGDEIWVKAGVHYPGAAGNRTATFTLKNGVALYGGFAGTESNRNERNWQTNITILSGDIDRNDNHGGDYINENASQIVGSNAYHVVTGGGTNNTAILDGFIITAGQANGASWPNNAGGGMYNESSSPTLVNITLSGNLAVYGGGMYNNTSAPVLTNVVFFGNLAGQGGGGMNNYGYANPTLTNVAFNNNSAQGGGGIYNAYSSPSLTEVTFSGNSSTHYGGGMYNYNNSPTLTDVIFRDNSANHGGGIYNIDNGNPVLMDCAFSGNYAQNFGGGIYNANSRPELTNVIFSGNESANQGGGMYNRINSTPKLTNTTFIGNGAGREGGAMYNYSNSNPIILNVVFSSNFADLFGGGVYNYQSSPLMINTLFFNNFSSWGGGGVLNYQGRPVLRNVTFSGNSSETYGGGMANVDSSLATIVNSILWNNSAPNGPEIYNDSSSNVSITYSNIQGGWAGDGNIEADPLFVDAANGNLRLQLTSPAIDAGNNAAVPPGVTTDLDGKARFVDIPTVPDTGNGTPPIVDMGAYEAQGVDIVLGKAVAPPSAAPGQAITFTLRLSNSGESSIPASGIVVTDTLPAILSGLSFTSTLAITDTGHIPPYVWTVQDLAAGQGGVITVSGILTVPLAAGVYTNTAVITATGDLLAGNNTAIVTFTVPNVAPVFTSAPVVTATQDAPYIYNAAAADDNGDLLTITAPTLPAWLTLTDHGDGTATLSGTPGSVHIGDHAVVLRVTDRAGAFAEQSFTIRVAERPRYYIFLPLVLRNTP